MKRPWQIASLIFVFLSLFVLIHSFSYPYKDRLGPGPGFFPFWMSLITGALSLALFLQTTFAKSEKEEKKSFFPNRGGRSSDCPHPGLPGDGRGFPESPRVSDQSVDFSLLPPSLSGSPKLARHTHSRNRRQFRGFPRFLLLAEIASAHRHLWNLRREFWRLYNTGSKDFPLPPCRST